MCLTNDSLSDIDVFNQKYSTLCNYEKKLINYLRDKDVKSQCQCIIEGLDSKFAIKERKLCRLVNVLFVSISIHIYININKLKSIKMIHHTCN